MFSMAIFELAPHSLPWCNLFKSNEFTELVLHVTL